MFNEIHDIKKKRKTFQKIHIEKCAVKWALRINTSTLFPTTKFYLLICHQCQNIFINPLQNKPWLFTCLQYKSFEKNVGKGETTRNELFCIFSTVFSIPYDNFKPFSSKSKMSSAKSLNLKASKICRMRKG